MYRLPLKVLIFLLTVGSAAQQSTSINEDYASASDIWPNKCRPPPSDPQPPNLEDLELDDILPVGVHQMNLQARKAQNGSLGATFVFGNVGSGKSIVVPLIVGDLNKLNFGSNSSVYRNDNLFGPTSTTSMLRMLLPEYSLYQSDDFGQTAIWDCPGFNYSRGSKADIAQSYFLKHALEISKSASFLFTIKHSSVMLENDVRMLATYATNLVKDVGKFRDSIGLIVTDVNVTGEDQALSSIRAFLHSYIEAEKTKAYEKRENVSGANETNKISNRINFIEGLLQDEGAGGGNYSRIYLINNNIQDVCGGAQNMSVTSDLISKLNIFHTIILRHTNIVPGELGLNLRRDTIRKIKYGMWAKEVKGVGKHSIETAQGIIKELERALLGSRNEYDTNTFLNGFGKAFNRHFFGNNGRGHVYESTGNEMHPMNNEIDFFLSCASQRKKTIQFFVEAMGERSVAVPISTLSQPFQIAGAKLDDLADFYTFCNYTYHALGEYSNQRILKDLKNTPGVVGLGENNVLGFLTNEFSIEIPDQITKMWEKNLDHQSKKTLVDLVRKQIPEIKFHYSQAAVKFGGGECEYTAIGRNVMFSDLYDYSRHYGNPDYCSVYKYNLVAVEKLFIDQQITRLDVVHGFKFISFVGPVWEVVSNGTEDIVHINLDGVESWQAGSKSGGSFFGAYSTIINSNALLITANGNDRDPCYANGTNAGSIHLVSTSSNVSVRTEACPGNFFGGYTDTTYMPVSGIVNYNSEYSRTSLLDCFSSQSGDFFEKIAIYDEFTEMELTKDPLALATELEALEQEYFSRGHNIHNCPGKMKRRMAIYYQRTFNLIEEQVLRADPGDKFALTIIGSLLLSRLINNRRLEMSLNVFSTEQYLDAIAEDLESLEKLENQMAIMKETEKFKSSLDEKVKASETLVSTILRPALDSSKAGLMELNKKLFDTLEAFREEAEKNLEAAKKQLSDWYSLGNLAKYLFGAMEIVGYGLMISGGPVAPYGVALLAGGSLLGAAVGNEQPPIPQLSAVVQADDDKVYDQVLNSAARRISRADEVSTGAPISEDGKLVKHSALTLAGIKKSAEIVKDIRSDVKRHNAIKDTVSKLENQINQLENQKNRVNKTFAPAMNKLSSSVVDQTSKLNGTSLSGLSVKKWEMKKMLKTMRQFVQGFTKWIDDAQKKMVDAGKNVTGERGLFETFMSTIDSMEDAAGVVYEVYAYIQMYQEKKEFAQFIANVNSPTTGKLADLPVQLQDIIKRFQFSIKINLVIEEYKKAEHAFKQWVFPFPSSYLKTKNEVAFLQSKNLSHVVSTCKEEIYGFRSALKKYNAITTASDDHLYYYNFTSDAVSTRPFYVWTNEKWRDAIGRLFQGEAIRLKADVDLIGHANAKFFQYKTAIKFKHINLFLRAHNKSLQDDLDGILKNFRMHMTHSGVSIYKVNGQQFVMRDKAQTYRYNFEKHIGVNAIKYKVEGPRSDVLLSPYTWWTLEMTDLEEIGFEMLQKHAPSVDLVLEGSGTYLDEKEAGSAFLNDLNLSEYYEAYEPRDDEVLPHGEIPTQTSHRRCGMGLAVHPKSTEPTPSIFNQSLTSRNHQSVGNTCNVPNPKNFAFNSTLFLHEYSISGLMDYFKAMGMFLEMESYSEDSYGDFNSFFVVGLFKLPAGTYYAEFGPTDPYSTNNNRIWMTFTSGIEFETELYDGRKVNNTITVDEERYSVFRSIKMADFEATNEFEVSYLNVSVTLRAKDAVARITFGCFNTTVYGGADLGYINPDKNLYAFAV